jgi:hypothetical protein
MRPARASEVEPHSHFFSLWSWQMLLHEARGRHRRWSDLACGWEPFDTDQAAREADDLRIPIQVVPR